MKSRPTSPISWALAMGLGAVLVSALVYGVVSRYVNERAEANIRNVMLTHRGLHRYIQENMHPTFFKAQADGQVGLDFYSPIIFSSSYIVRVMHGLYNEERVKDGRPPIYYKMASDNPRNPVNRATPYEAQLLRRFNEQRDLKEFREVTDIDGEPFLVHAMPFLETGQACLRCHGKREKAPIGLQNLYPGEGGFNEHAGVIRAVEIIRAPLSKERYAALLLTGGLLGGLVGLGSLTLFNRHLRSKVQERTFALEMEIVERGRAEQQVRILNQDLERRVDERTQQLKAANHELDAFAYSVSHDLRAPLRAIDGFSQALDEDYGETLQVEGRDYLHRIRRGCTRMGDLIEDLLTLSRSTRRPMENLSLDLSRIAQEVIQELRSTGADGRTEFVVQPGLVAQGDPVLVRSVLQNLIGNAVKFSSKVETPRVEVGMVSGSHPAAFFVRDNGAGFDMAYRDKLFGAFQRLHDAEEFPGSGIGLATVQRIVQRHGGHVQASSQPGEGALFTFTLGA